MKKIFIDVETTGLDPKTDSIIEIACLFEDGIEDHKSVYHRYITPASKPDDFDKITEITGITWELLEKYGSSEKFILEGLEEWLKDRIDNFDSIDKAFFIAYNAKFDNDFVRELFLRNENAFFGSFFRSCSIDIMSLVGVAVEEGMMPVPENFQNKTIAKLLDIELKNAHSAFEDIKASRLIYYKCLKLIKLKK